MILLILALPAEAFQFELLDGQPMRWDTSLPVSYQIDREGLPPALEVAPARLAIDTAFNTWSRAEGGPLVFVRRPDAVEGSVARVFWTSEWPYDPGLIALSSIWSSDDGTILDFDVALRSDAGWSTTGTDGYDLQNAMTHEVGHVVGLAHESRVTMATMYPDVQRTEVHKRDLHTDDLDGYQGLYWTSPPSAEPVSACRLPVSPGRAMLPGPLLLLAVAGARRRR